MRIEKGRGSIVKGNFKYFNTGLLFHLHIFYYRVVFCQSFSTCFGFNDIDKTIELCYNINVKIAFTDVKAITSDKSGAIFFDVSNVEVCMFF